MQGEVIHFARTIPACVCLSIALSRRLLVTQRPKQPRIECDAIYVKAVHVVPGCGEHVSQNTTRATRLVLDEDCLLLRFIMFAHEFDSQHLSQIGSSITCAHALET